MGIPRIFIKKKLRSVVFDLIESVDDMKVKNAISQSVMIMGGSIASMLLGETVNDYDLYFTNVHDAKTIINYYLKDTDLSVREGVVPNIYGIDEQRLLTDVNGFLFLSPEKGKKYQPKVVTNNSITLTNNTQLIFRFVGSTDEIFKNFDFIHACNCYKYAADELLLNSHALESLLSKQLYYQGSYYPLTSIFRTRKFIKRGWNINAGQMLKIMIQASFIDYNNRVQLKEQLMGVDTLFVKRFLDRISLIKGTLDKDVMTDIIDDVFEKGVYDIHTEDVDEKNW